MDSVTYGTLFNVCASNNQCEEAEKYFKNMKDEGHTPNVFHYGSLINAYSAKGNFEKADELIATMKDAGLVPNKVCFYVPFVSESDNNSGRQAVNSYMTMNCNITRNVAFVKSTAENHILC